MDAHATNHRRFLEHCQVDTPTPIVDLVWRIAHRYRKHFDQVGDLGCGDARFARSGHYNQYVGLEVDPARTGIAIDRRNVRVQFGCVFETGIGHRFDLCIGNPPYVRHHDIDPRWRRKAERVLADILPFVADGRANAYVYFVWLALALTSRNGLVVLLLPREWRTRPASSKLREYIRDQRWSVDVYQLDDETFDRVLTTSSICVVDKANTDARWRSFKVESASSGRWSEQPIRARYRVLPYEEATNGETAQRGLSPGHQKALLLTEGERLRFGLALTHDVLPAVSSFRHLSEDQLVLSESLFRQAFVNRGRRCWLINPIGTPSPELSGYFGQVPEGFRSTATCRSRDDWWRFQLPRTSQVLYASGFVTDGPKAFLNEVGAVHVGGIHGIFCSSKARALAVLKVLRGHRFAPKVVPLSKGFKKIEVRQMNAFLNRLDNGAPSRRKDA